MFINMLNLAGRYRILQYIVPLILWLFIFRYFVTGVIVINGDTNSNYLILKYFFNSILNGTFPLWDPYTYFGRHFLYIFSSCALNPFAWSIPFMCLIGFDFYQAYIVFIVSYFFLGCFGFRFLIKEMLKDESAAFLGFILLLFSGMGAMLFNQILIVYIFVPVVWFLVFAVRFFRTYAAFDFLMAVFTLMIISVSYLPFYFVTFLSILCLLFVVVFPDVFLECFHGLRRFVFQKFYVVMLGLLAIVIAAGPMIIIKMIDAKGDCVFPGRHQCQSVDQSQCEDDGGMSYGEIAYFGSLGERFAGGMLFSHLDKVDYNSDDFVYVSVFVYILIFLAIFMPFDRLRFFILALGFLIFLIAMGAVTPVYKFFYERITFFGYFRNLYFFISFLIPIVIFFAAVQYKSLIDAKKTFRFNFVLAVVFLVAVLMLWIFSFQEHVLEVSYATVFLSCLAVFWFFLYERNERIIFRIIIFTLLTVLEPWYVFASYQNNIPSYQCELPKDWDKGEFSWVRPDKNILSVCMPLYKREFYSSLRYAAALRDSHGLFILPDTLMRYSYDLLLKVSKTDVFKYTTNKIVTYERVQSFDEHLDLNTLNDSLRESANLAFITNSDGRFEKLIRTEGQGLRKSFAVHTGDDQQVKVVKFNANRLVLDTNFFVDKFLVYIDSYSSGWKVYINGREDKIYRSNMAFKGVYLPAGKNVVDFRYQPPGGVMIYWLVLLAMIIVPVTGICFRLRGDRDDA